ncbi:MAG: LPS assembly lipoprotein LptE [Planctomycetota bacterium]|nr:LPS assembly lipoprotein LptE [Planctomycetota bacterium]
MKHGSLLGLVLASAGLAGGCGYSTGIRVADRIGSVGVAYFGNKTLEPDVERPLQDALTAKLRSLTDVPIAAPESAEVILRGVILDYRRRGGVRSAENKLLETGLYLEAEGGLYDRRTDRALGPQKRSRIWIGYVLDEPQGETNARDRAIQYVAEDLILQLFAPLE